ncbi:MAG: hypothetical protein MJ061_03500 [Mailhella sp.]|nr:hypothetical protein [Mailhella sp.]
MTGNPIRTEIMGVAETEKRGLSLLVMGGSLGAKALNSMIVDMLPELKEAGIDIIHQTGRREYDAVRRGYAEAGWTEEEISRTVRPFIDDMAGTYARSALAFCRAGATSMAELAATGTPAVYVPFPFAAHDHQTANARAMQDAGGGVLLPQEEASAMSSRKELAPMIISLLRDEAALASMRAGARSLARPDAASAVADILIDLAGSGR